jgi:hypothetical protein
LIGLVAACVGEIPADVAAVAPGDATADAPEAATEPVVDQDAPRTAVSVWFLQGDVLGPVAREVPEAFRYRATLQRLFEGPTPQEAAAGWTLVGSGATGFSRFRLADGVAEITLTGSCDGGGQDLTVADHVRATVAQFPEIRSVRIRDPDGETHDEADPASIPLCLIP